MNELNALYEFFNLTTIRQAIAEHRVEDLHLDFKTLRNSSFDRDDRRNLATAMSGFANSDGGVIVWGVDARKSEDGIDCAEAERLIPSVHMTLSRLQTLTGEAASPVPDGVEHRVAPAEGEADFIVSLVPPSDAGPHMAKLGEDRYYKRSGDSFRRMEHFDLEDMFGRRKRPVLELNHRLMPYGSRSGSPRTVHLIVAVVGIANRGRGVARFPNLELRIHPPHRVAPTGLDGQRHTGLPELARPGPPGVHHIFAGGVDDVIHIGSVREVTLIGPLEVSEGATSTLDVTIEYLIAAEGVQPVEGRHVIPASEILALVPP